MSKTTSRQHSNRQADPSGSHWHRWDPHIHAPGTILADGFKQDWDGYLKAVESHQPTVRALGITDYGSITSYKEVVKQQQKGRLPDVDLIFPNVEFRLDVETDKKKGINIHLLFSPHDDEHVKHIERILPKLTYRFKGQRYHCEKSQLVSLGKAYDQSTASNESAFSEGTKQFKVNLDELKKIFDEDEWLRQNCLVAVAAGRHDGTSGLQKDASFGSKREDIETFAQIIFSGNPSTREFWLGQKPSPTEEDIKKRYGFLKPCLHGSDAHRVADVCSPDMNRFCWIKGDVHFESLKQAILEPERRVWIGSQPPPDSEPSLCITSMKTKGLPWLSLSTVDLNPGFVAVIGPRGSGKTALADFLARGATSLPRPLGQSSFIRRASTPTNYLTGGSIQLTWDYDDVASSVSASPGPDHDTNADVRDEDVRYLSQSFVDRLCSSDGLATELVKEMERVVFLELSQILRGGVSSFPELVKQRATPARSRRKELEEELIDTHASLLDLFELKRRLPELDKQKKRLEKSIAEGQKRMKELLPKDSVKKAKALLDVREAKKEKTTVLQTLERRRQTLVDLKDAADQIIKVTEPNRHRRMRSQYQRAELSDSQWDRFRMSFDGEIYGLLSDLTRRIQEKTKRLREKVDGVDYSSTALKDLPYNVLVERETELEKTIGFDKKRQQKYDREKLIAENQQQELKSVAELIENGATADPEIERLKTRVFETYEGIFDAFESERAILLELYAPLDASMRAQTGAIASLDFVVERDVDVDAWVKRGEQLLDLRRKSAFKGKGNLELLVAEHIKDAWVTGTPAEVRSRMKRFRDAFDDEIKDAMPSNLNRTERKQWLSDVSTWLYDTGHISLRYSIRYSGVDIQSLSPGTKGIVLLLLYLVIDRQDNRPLIIDQPEENLDPQSIYDELVPHFREARLRRQIVIVTHNANLVVNTDVDQVIIASSIKDDGPGIPKINYESGSLENSAIRNSVCAILEGGRQAFIDREKRYRLIRN